MTSQNFQIRIEKEDHTFNVIISNTLYSYSIIMLDTSIN